VTAPLAPITNRVLLALAAQLTGSFGRQQTFYLILDIQYINDS
jgi:hypothetical protein